MGDSVSQSLSCPVAGSHEPFPPFPSVQQMQHPDAASCEENVSIGIVQYGYRLQAPVQPKPLPLLAGKFLSSSLLHETVRLGSSPLPSPFLSYLPSSPQRLALPCSGSPFPGQWVPYLSWTPIAHEFSKVMTGNPTDASWTTQECRRCPRQKRFWEQTRWAKLHTRPSS